MDFGLNSSAAYMNVLERWQGSVAANLAASNVPGFKGHVFAVEIPSGDNSRAAPQGIGSASPLPTHLSIRNHIGGNPRTTGNPMDFSIQGPGFFALSAPDGKVLYTRNGTFQLGPEGTLLSNHGLPVMGHDGSPILLPPSEGPVTTAADGSLTQNGNFVGRLGLFEFADRNALEGVGNQFWTDPEGLAKPVPATQSTIMQGALESPNIEPLREMVNLISIARSYEAAQKLITTGDELRGKAIQALSTP